MAEWIAVAEAMPQRFVEVLACFCHKGVPVVVQGTLSWDGKRWCYGVGAFGYSGTVTHWMELPPAPALGETQLPRAALDEAVEASREPAHD